MEGETGNQSKQERFRTRWTPSLDRIFADLVVQQIQLGNRPNNVFDKKTWNHIRDEFNKETGSKFNNNQLRKHLDVLRTRFNNVKSAFARNDFALVDPCGVGFDLWEDSFGAQPRPETAKVKDCPIYEQLCKIFTDTSADGKYAQSSHFEGLDKSVGDDSAEKAVKNAGERKRKRPSETPSSEQNTRDEELNKAMAEALLEMVAASKWREVAARHIEERFTITNCIKALDEIQKIDQQLYFAALDLFEDPTVRETFLSLKGDDLRLTWLQGKGFSSGKVIDLVITTRKALGSCSCRFAILVPIGSSCGWWRALSTADARDALGKAFFSMAHPFAIHNMNLDLSNSGYWR
ncbi:hypothetical protein OIU77_026097 [Salix suchowensis]|uniref:Myb/SANT-like domain-containing protein n=1 Tax=Salix suchowensis TaxID=1278906 RepID=A0ABQ9BYJ1_9ROSI|nr:hypothetical protein OIU77_026097 [Salix suchowensis]